MCTNTRCMLPDASARFYIIIFPFLFYFISTSQGKTLARIHCMEMEQIVLLPFRCWQSLSKTRPNSVSLGVQASSYTRIVSREMLSLCHHRMEDRIVKSGHLTRIFLTHFWNMEINQNTYKIYSLVEFGVTDQNVGDHRLLLNSHFRSSGFESAG